MTAVHSIEYEDLPHFFLLFSIWNEKNECLSWDETVEYAKMLGIHTVPVLFDGIFDEVQLRNNMFVPGTEGFVVRLARAFRYEVFGRCVAKYVRADHVQSDEHWMHQEVRFNKWRS
jgi:hypothetical protein